jgi:hypothetical protein
MSAESLSPEDAKLFRSRVQAEDTLLNSRTQIVLQLNGIAAVVMGLPAPTEAKSVAIAIILFLDLGWIVCAIDANHLMRRFTKRVMESNAAPADESFREAVQKGRFRFGTTRFMSVWLPVLLFFGWLAGVFLVCLRTPLGHAVPNRAWFIVVGTCFSVIGTAVLAWGLIISDRDASELGVSYLPAGNQKDVLNLPPVADRRRQSRNARWALLLMVIGAALEIWGAWP